MSLHLSPFLLDLLYSRSVCIIWVVFVHKGWMRGRTAALMTDPDCLLCPLSLELLGVHRPRGSKVWFPVMPRGRESRQGPINYVSVCILQHCFGNRTDSSELTVLSDSSRKIQSEGSFRVTKERVFPSSLLRSGRGLGFQALPRLHDQRHSEFMFKPL